MIQQRLIVEIAQLADRAEVVVLPPLCPLAVSSFDFRRADELISRARRSSGEWLDDGYHRMQHPERVLSAHPHHASRATCATSP